MTDKLRFGQFISEKRIQHSMTKQDRLGYLQHISVNLKAEQEAIQLLKCLTE